LNPKPQPRLLIAILLGMLGVLVGYATGLRNPHPLQLRPLDLPNQPGGDVASWFRAIGTLGASAVAAAVLIRELQTRHEAQARRVSAWLKLKIEARPPWIGGKISDPEFARLIVHNGSGEPVYRVRVESLNKKGTQTLRPGAGHKWHAAWVPPSSILTTESTTTADEIGPLRLEFADAAGHRWRRDGAQLRQLKGRFRDPVTAPAYRPNAPRDTVEDWYKKGADDERMTDRLLQMVMKPFQVAALIFGGAVCFLVGYVVGTIQAHPSSLRALWLSTIAWGNFPSWLGAIGTVAGFAIAVELLIHGLQTRREAQARTVSAWLKLKTEIGPLPLPDDPDFVRLMVRNGGNDPIYEVLVESLYYGNREPVRHGVAHHWYQDLISADTLVETNSTTTTGWLDELRIDFGDSAGLRWRRDRKGLRQLKGRAEQESKNRLIEVLRESPRLSGG